MNNRKDMGLVLGASFVLAWASAASAATFTATEMMKRGPLSIRPTRMDRSRSSRRW
jgi:hypothetical protein